MNKFKRSFSTNNAVNYIILQTKLGANFTKYFKFRNFILRLLFREITISDYCFMSYLFPNYLQGFELILNGYRNALLMRTLN